MYLINSSGPIAATGTLFTFNVGMEDSITLIVDDNGGGSTITVETSPDNSAWTAFTGGFSMGSGALTALNASTFTAKGKYVFPLVVAANAYIRFRVSTYVSGYVSARAEPSTIRLSDLPRSGVLIAAAPTGTTKDDALPIWADYVRISTATLNTGIRLPHGKFAGDKIVIFNGGANAINVYPPEGVFLNGTVNNSNPQSAGVQRQYVWDGTAWWSFL